ncbi:hypothetical protein [Nannocystis pusilla]|uniref:hypothetical protein n=1 Tax=Nannocystis pusilla TaxID=889268 RepID=UPI003DA480CB
MSKRSVLSGHVVTRSLMLALPWALLAAPACDGGERKSIADQIGPPTKKVSELKQESTVSEEELARRRKEAGFKSKAEIDAELAAENAKEMEKAEREWIKTRIKEYKQLERRHRQVHRRRRERGRQVGRREGPAEGRRQGHQAAAGPLQGADQADRQAVGAQHQGRQHPGQLQQAVPPARGDRQQPRADDRQRGGVHRGHQERADRARGHQQGARGDREGRDPHRQQVQGG